MKSVTIAELKKHLSKYLREVEAGAEIVVTDRDRPIARVVPQGREPRRTRIVSPGRPFTSIRDRRFGRARWKTSSTDLLLEERQKR